MELRVGVSGDLARTFVQPEETAVEVKHEHNLEEATEKRIEESSVVIAVQRGNPPPVEGIASSDPDELVVFDPDAAGER